MGVPKQVELQMLEVAEIERSMVAQPEINPVDGVVSEATPAPATALETPAEVIPDQPKEVPEVSEETWKQKYKTLNGMFNAEVPRLHQQVKQLTAKMEQMNSRMVEKAAEPAPERLKLVTDQEIETFGPDLLDVQRRIVKEEHSQFEYELKQMREENSKLREQVQNTDIQMDTMSFEKRLARAVPDFESINDDPKWVGWLDEIDPILRAARRTVAQQAFDTGDVEAIADYVRMFKGAQTPVRIDTRQTELERQVAPGRTGSSGSNIAPQVKLYTEAQAAAVFLKVRDMNIRGQRDEAATLEAEISTAYMEGRVR